MRVSVPASRITDGDGRTVVRIEIALSDSTILPRKEEAVCSVEAIEMMQRFWVRRIIRPPLINARHVIV